jgi:DNA invertase Pin-like site-specific DNA recombinase
MPDGRFVSYLRVSTDRQGRSGLGIEAQRAAVAEYLNGGNWRLVSEVVEIESGKRNDRVKLAEAMNLCRAHRATLVIAKLDRLSRDAAFLMNLESAGIDFVAVDMPNANRVTVRIMAVIAEEERRMISARTKAALAAAKARGTVLGGFRGRAGTADDTARARAQRSAQAASRAGSIMPIIADIEATGARSLAAVAAGLNERGVPTASGRGAWTAIGVSRVKARG